MNSEPGLYWLFYVANDLQFYAFVMMPSIYLYQKKSHRKYVLIFNSFLILFSMFYLIIMTWEKDYTTIFIIDSTKKFDLIYRRPYGPVGFYSLGILLSIFYFEY